MILQVGPYCWYVDGLEVLHHLGCVKPCTWWAFNDPNLHWFCFLAGFRLAINSISIFHKQIGCFKYPPLGRAEPPTASDDDRKSFAPTSQPIPLLSLMRYHGGGITAALGKWRDFCRENLQIYHTHQQNLRQTKNRSDGSHPGKIGENLLRP